MADKTYSNWRYDSREFEGAHYYERGVLSCIIAGALVPGGISACHFIIPRNRIIFQSLCAMEQLNLVDLRDRGIHAKFEILLSMLRNSGTLEAAGGEDYVREIEGMIGIPSAAPGFAVGLLRYCLGKEAP